jgi:hypothetical protein
VALTASKPECAARSKRPVRVRIPFSCTTQRWQGRAARLPTELLAWNKRQILEGNDGTEMAVGDSEMYRYIEGDEYSGGSWETKLCSSHFKCF